MQVMISFRQLNKDFSQELANEWNNGNEDYENSKIAFSTAFQTNNDKDAISRLKNVSMQFGNAEGIIEEKLMEIVKWWIKGVELLAGVETCLLDKIDIYYNKAGDKEYCYFYLDKDKNFEFINDTILNKPMFVIEKKII